MRNVSVMFVLALVSRPLAAQSERLGTISFPTSGSSAAQERFIRGTLFLHSFEYEAAAREYREAQRLDPRFVMAYWGEAMTYNHPVWDQQDKAAALAVLNRLAATRSARASLAKSDKEMAWLKAVEVLYGEGTKAERDTLYAREMEGIATRWPDDDEAQSFFALALMGLSRTTRVVTTYMRAGAIALAVMARNPDHPGATHYAIHAFDDPIHAPLGLHAAEAYSGIAPGAAHAQHMTTHIFLALGMWDEVVLQNVIASGADTTTWKPGHYTAWLLYGLLQQGRFADASRHLNLIARNLTSSDPLSRRATLVQMQDYYVINAEKWDFTGPEPDLQGVGPNFRAVHAFTTGYAALKRNQVAQARVQLDTLLRMTDSSGPTVGVLAYELAGVVHLAAGDTARGLDLMRQAAAIEDTIPMEFGPPLIIKPTHELLGETYLALDRPLQAQAEFVRALELAPMRLRSLLGLWRAAGRAGDTAIERKAAVDLGNMLHREATDWVQSQP